jgi:hypothetical protein
MGEAGGRGLGPDWPGLRIRGCWICALFVGAENRAARPGPVGLVVGVALGPAAGALRGGFTVPSAALRDWGFTTGAGGALIGGRPVRGLGREPAVGVEVSSTGPLEVLLPLLHGRASFSGFMTVTERPGCCRSRRRPCGASPGPA